MRIVASEAPPGLVEERRRLGHDRFDEMWEGVLHMNAVPHREHQILAIQLGNWLYNNWRGLPDREVFPERNVSLPGGWPKDYRIPDLVLTTAERFHYDQGTHIEGPPLVCMVLHHHLRSGEAIHCPIESGVAVLVFPCMVNESWRTGRMMAWDAEKKETVSADTVPLNLFPGETPQPSCIRLTKSDRC